MEFVNIELEHYNHKVGLNFWHLEWVTKYRYKMFVKFKYKSLCEACIRKVANRHNLKIHVLSVMPDHIHILVTLPKGIMKKRLFSFLREFCIPFLSQPSKSTLPISSRAFVGKRWLRNNSWLQSV